jgi:hypothetical protein
MQGYIPVEIPTKKYVKAYIIAKLGARPAMNMHSTIGQKLYDVLEHKSNERKTEFSNERYNTRIKIYISKHTFINRGCYLNETNIKNFNIFVERELKTTFRLLMDHYIEVLPSFEAHLPALRKKIGIDIEDWSDDSIRKDYYRYRQKENLPPLYNKNISPRTVASDKHANNPF